MATSSLLGIDSDNLPAPHSATGIDSLGPSDASDSGSDSAGAYSDEPDSDTDRFGTGERSSADLSERPDAQDILPDHIETLDTGTDGPTADEPDMDMDAARERPALDQRAGAQRSPTESPMRADDLAQEGDPDGEDGSEEDDALKS
jgi:hypothetical protein